MSSANNNNSNKSILEREKELSPVYDEWFKVEFKVQKSPQVTIEGLVNDVKNTLNHELGYEYKDLVIEGKTIEYASARPDGTDAIPVSMWRRIYKDTKSHVIFDLQGNIDIAQEVDLTAEAGVEK